MIDTSISDSPSLQLKGEPHSETVGHHLLDDLLGQQSFPSNIVGESVETQLKSIPKDSTIMSTSISLSLTSSTDITDPLISDCPSTDVLHSSHPLMTTATPSTDIPYPLTVSTQILTSQISSVEDIVVVQSLLGLREGSDISESERMGCSQAKGEAESSKMHAISSGMAKESERSATLDGEGEGVRCVSQGESLMQEYREIERNAGTGDIRVDTIASELMDVDEANKEMSFQ